jgi:hypothetical protein
VPLLAAVVLATVLSYPIGLRIGSAYLLPILNAAPAYAAMFWLLRRGEARRAVALMLVWALTLGLTATVSFALWPRAVDATVVNGPEYRDEMFAWIHTGVGREGSPRLFIPQHLVHLAAFVVLSLVTASALSIAMGAVLMNYMAFYVASLGRAGVPAWAVLLLGWQPWALCRVAAFTILGVVLAQPLVRRTMREAAPPSWRPWLLLAGVGLVADVLLKSSLAPSWGRWLHGLLP